MKIYGRKLRTIDFSDYTRSEIIAHLNGVVTIYDYRNAEWKNFSDYEFVENSIALEYFSFDFSEVGKLIKQMDIEYYSKLASELGYNSNTKNITIFKCHVSAFMKWHFAFEANHVHMHSKLNPEEFVNGFGPIDAYPFFNKLAGLRRVSLKHFREKVSFLQKYGKLDQRYLPSGVIHPNNDGYIMLYFNKDLKKQHV